MGIWSLIVSFFLTLTLWGEETALSEWKKFSKTKASEELMEFIRCSATEELQLKNCDHPIPETPPFFGELGLFITIVNKGKVRGCFGAFRHKNTQITNVLQDYIRGALRQDPRYPPLEIEELKTAYFILTIADSPAPVADTESIPLGRYGVLLTKENGQGVVYVPGEIKSHSSLKRIMQKEKIQDVSIFKAILIR
ncbi:MAG TPA: AMMECR1 domain-containing protein [Leptospiraceae bacterium]|nr:AMMECR1 domain-containing protein [Leptospiraceae bacterium]HMW06768.1 AMMECR1 domain-containing protein [Leptospiraceae bacterium]HMX33319.1 AMMECR1 domain-containing protein [Leptospiraceae bacterium]HMY32074.1 AMMECR1 domain-containing protein [Leptospiraceae bacterium]HMZ63997.1 AMMECR1 domain-containing protein [Leptospiraceae bacterium]